MTDVSGLSGLPHLRMGTAPQIGETVTVTIKPDFTAFNEAVGRAAKTTTTAMAKLTRAFQRANESWAKERVVYVAGLGARYYVRGGLDSRYRDDAEMCALVHRLLRGEELADLNFQERSQVATMFIIGWVQGQGKGQPVDCGPDGTVPVQRNGSALTATVVP